ncbi:hypothetical protein [Streptomyces radicis]|uniref:Uncharacterized protein n=1 Tax=Streptomyces radicis TaxID=1750517 RepID=A0A3A9WF25_9ACTN|nr:hypothetical protein [Streptomyces radicis]RKN10903.1 hypothetical protein D7319_07085 [Streptomyces radicis]RKN25166.1 hypothetical protein D7318_07940 [Streptomyces radicis]
MAADPLAHLLRQLSPENRCWLEDQPEDRRRALAEEWRGREGKGTALLASTDLLPDLVDEGAEANAFIDDVRDADGW